MNDFIMNKYFELQELTNCFLKDYTWVNIKGKTVADGDYVTAGETAEKKGRKEKFSKSLKKNISDMKKIVMNFYCVCCETERYDNFATLFAMYCNHYIKYGLNCFTEETENTMFGLEKADFSGNSDFLSYIEEIYNGIRTQIYSHFERAAGICPEYSVAYLYLFVKNAVNYFYLLDISADESKIAEQKNIMLKYYKKLPSEYAEYALSSGKYYLSMPNTAGVDYNGHGDDMNVLPHIIFKSNFRIYTENLITHFDTFNKNSNNLTASFSFQQFMQTANYVSKELKNPTHSPFAEGREEYSKKHKLFRIEFLHICNLVQPCNNWKILNNIMHDNLNLEKARADRAEVIQEFSHKFKNMRATQLGNIAKSLLAMNDTNLKKYGRAVLLEYGIKQNLIKEVEMLQMRFDDKLDELLSRVRNSMSADSGYKIKNLLDESFRRCLITLLHDGSNSGKRFREAFRQPEFDFIALRNDFEDNVLFQENNNILTWFLDHFFPIDVEFSDDWTELSFINEDYAAIFLTDILTELTANIFKYGDKTKPCRFIFDSNEETLSITAENSIDFNLSHKQGTQRGLSSMKKNITMLNHAAGCKGEFLTSSQKDGVFRVTLSLSKAIFDKKEGGDLS